MKFNQALKKIEEGYKIYLPDETGHIYGIENKKVSCSCGRSVEWLNEYKLRDDWKIAKWKGLNFNKMSLKDVEFCIDNTDNLKRILKQFAKSKDGEKNE